MYASETVLSQPNSLCVVQTDVGFGIPREYLEKYTLTKKLVRFYFELEVS